MTVSRFACAALLLAGAQLSWSASGNAEVAATMPATTQAALSADEAKAAVSAAIAPLVKAAMETAKTEGATEAVLRVAPNGQAAAERYPVRQAIVAAALDHGTGVLTLDETFSPDKPLRQPSAGSIVPKWVAQQSGDRAGKTYLGLAYRAKAKEWAVDAVLVDAKRVLWRSSATLDASWVAALGTDRAFNEPVLAFARKNLGTQVGNGECWTLAADAMRAAGAGRPDRYVFGRELEPDEPIAPGDVLHFDAVKVVEGRRTLTLGSPNHVAVVSQVLGPNRVKILHQNFGGKRTVMELDLNLAAMTEGKTKIYRVQPREPEPRRVRDPWTRQPREPETPRDGRLRTGSEESSSRS